MVSRAREDPFCATTMINGDGWQQQPYDQCTNGMGSNVQLSLKQWGQFNYKISHRCNYLKTIQQILQSRANKMMIDAARQLAANKMMIDCNT